MKNKILIIEDSATNAFLLKEGLVDLYQVFINMGENWEEDLNIFNPDLIIIDLSLRGITGYEIYNKIKNKGIITLIATAHRNKSEIAYNLGGFDFENIFIKPISLDDLRAKIQKLLDGKC